MLEKELKELVDKNLPTIAATAVLDSLKEKKELEKKLELLEKQNLKLEKEIVQSGTDYTKITSENISLRNRDEEVQKKESELLILEKELKDKELKRELEILKIRLDEAYSKNSSVMEMIKIMFKNPTYKKEYIEDIHRNVLYKSNGDQADWWAFRKEIKKVEWVLEDDNL